MRVLLSLSLLVTTASANPAAAPRPAPKPQGESTLTPSQVTKVMRARAPVFRACFNSALKTNPKLRGAFGYTFTIEPSGKVSRAAPIKGTPESVPVDTCIVGKLETTVFPKSSSPTKISFPFNFSD